MQVLGRGRSRQKRKVDAAIRRHVHPVTADRFPGGRQRCFPVEPDGGSDRVRRQIAGCTRCPRPRGPRYFDLVGMQRIFSRPHSVDGGDAIPHDGVPRRIGVPVCGGRAAGVVLDLVPPRLEVVEPLDQVAGDRGAPVGRSCPIQFDRRPADGRPQTRRLPGYLLRQRHARGRLGNAWNPAGHRGGNHEEAGPQAQSVPSHSAASFRAVEKTCARLCVESISIGWRTSAPAPRGAVIAASPPRPASRG